MLWVGWCVFFIYFSLAWTWDVQGYWLEFLSLIMCASWWKILHVSVSFSKKKIYMIGLICIKLKTSVLQSKPSRLFCHTCSSKFLRNIIRGWFQSIWLIFITLKLEMKFIDLITWSLLLIRTKFCWKMIGLLAF